jgi:hypothetical protein
MLKDSNRQHHKGDREMLLSGGDPCGICIAACTGIRGFAAKAKLVGLVGVRLDDEFIAIAESASLHGVFDCPLGALDLL